jgi:acyl-CoA thioester hydrolase
MDNPQQAQQVSSIHIALRWGDMDALGHLNNTVYFRFFEEARISWLRNLQAQPSGGEGFLLASAACTFRRAVIYPETVAVSTFISAIGRSSTSLYQEIRSAGDTSIFYAGGESRLVWARFAEGRAAPLPESVRAQLEVQGSAFAAAGQKK